MDHGWHAWENVLVETHLKKVRRPDAAQSLVKLVVTAVMIAVGHLDVNLLNKDPLPSLDCT